MSRSSSAPRSTCRPRATSAARPSGSVSFYDGSDPPPAVTAALAVVGVFAIQVTFFAACLALHERRVEANRYELAPCFRRAAAEEDAEDGAKVAVEDAVAEDKAVAVARRGGDGGVELGKAPPSGALPAAAGDDDAPWLTARLTALMRSLGAWLTASPARPRAVACAFFLLAAGAAAAAGTALRVGADWDLFLPKGCYLLDYYDARGAGAFRLLLRGRDGPFRRRERTFESEFDVTYVTGRVVVERESPLVRRPSYRALAKPRRPPQATAGRSRTCRPRPRTSRARSRRSTAGTRPGATPRGTTRPSPGSRPSSRRRPGTRTARTSSSATASSTRAASGPSRASPNRRAWRRFWFPGDIGPRRRPAQVRTMERSRRAAADASAGGVKARAFSVQYLWLERFDAIVDLTTVSLGGAVAGVLCVCAVPASFRVPSSASKSLEKGPAAPRRRWHLLDQAPRAAGRLGTPPRRRTQAASCCRRRRRRWSRS